MSVEFSSAAEKSADARLKDLRAYIGESDAARAAADEVEAIVRAADGRKIAELQRVHAEDIVGTGPNQGPISIHKYIDVVYWTYWKYRLFQDLGLDKVRKKLRILDIGAGACHFAAVAKHFGHEVVSLDIDVPLYDRVAEAQGVKRTIVKVEPGVKLPKLGGKFDVVTAIAINFHNITPPDPKQPYWTLDQWKFLLNDLTANQLRYPGRVWFWLNQEMRDGKAVYNPEVLDLFERLGAEVDRKGGKIDWRLKAKPATVR